MKTSSRTLLSTTVPAAWVTEEREDLVGAQLDLTGRALGVDDEAGPAAVELERHVAAGPNASARRTSSGMVTWPFRVCGS